MNHFQKPIMQSQAYGVGANASAPQSADGCKGLRLFVEVTARGAAGTLDVKVQVQDVVAKQWHDLPGASMAQFAAVGRKVLTVYPGIAETANESVSDVLTGPFRVVGTVGTEAVTFSAGAVLLL